MVKIIKLTESDIVRITKQVITEMNEGPMVPKHIQRRYEDIKNGIDNYLMGYSVGPILRFSDFMTEVSSNVSNDILEKSKNDGDFVTSRNQMIQFIKNHFYEELKEYYDQNNYFSKNK